jgi:hypothetical protein
LGFFNLTADITGFEIDRDAIIIAIFSAFLFQIVKNNKKVEEEKSTQSKCTT